MKRLVQISKQFLLWRWVSLIGKNKKAYIEALKLRSCLDCQFWRPNEPVRNRFLDARELKFYLQQHNMKENFYFAYEKNWSKQCCDEMNWQVTLWYLSKEISNNVPLEDIQVLYNLDLSRMKIYIPLSKEISSYVPLEDIMADIMSKEISSYVPLEDIQVRYNLDLKQNENIYNCQMASKEYFGRCQVQHNITPGYIMR